MKNFERIYFAIIELAMQLVQDKKTMSCDELVTWINEKFPPTPPNHPYGGVRNVIKAAHNRAMTEEAKKALTSVFTDKDGNYLTDY